MKPVTESNLSVRAPGQRVAAMRDGRGLLEYRWRRAQRSFCRAASRASFELLERSMGVSIFVRGSRPVLLATRWTAARSRVGFQISESLASALLSRGEGRWRIKDWPFTGP